MADSPSPPPFLDPTPPPPPPPVHLLESFDAEQLLEYLRYHQVKAEQWKEVPLDLHVESGSGKETPGPAQEGTGETEEAHEREATSTQATSSRQNESREEEETIPTPRLTNQPDSSTDMRGTEQNSQRSHLSSPCPFKTPDNQRKRREDEGRTTKDASESKEKKNRREPEEREEEKREEEAEVRIVGQVKGEEGRGEKRYLWQAEKFEDPEKERKRQMAVKARHQREKRSRREEQLKGEVSNIKKELYQIRNLLDRVKHQRDVYRQLLVQHQLIPQHAKHAKK